MRRGVRSMSFSQQCGLFEDRVASCRLSIAALISAHCVVIITQAASRLNQTPLLRYDVTRSLDALSVCLSADRYIDGSLDRAVHAKASFTAYELTLTSRPSYTKRQLVT